MTRKDNAGRDARELQKLYGAKYQLCRHLVETLGFAGAGAALEAKGHKLVPATNEVLPANKAGS